MTLRARTDFWAAAGFSDPGVAEHAARRILRIVRRGCTREETAEQLAVIALENPGMCIESMIRQAAKDLMGAYASTGGRYQVEASLDGEGPEKDTEAPSAQDRYWLHEGLTPDGEHQLELLRIPARHLSTILGCSPTTAWRRRHRLIELARAGQLDFWLRPEGLI